jgi:hypothetical protein
VNFADLYRAVEAAGARPAAFEFLRDSVIEGIGWLEEVVIWRLTHSPPTREARYTLFDDRTGAYNSEYLVADISYCAALEDDIPELRFALTKELMHVFDDRKTWIDSREKFIKFLKDLQNTPIDFENGSVSSEHMARWMAILVLCPRPLRDTIKAQLTDKSKILPELAEELGLSEWLISVAVDDYYETAYKVLIGD